MLRAAATNHETFMVITTVVKENNLKLSEQLTGHLHLCHMQ
jgi:hypothetical protein